MGWAPLDNRWNVWDCWRTGVLEAYLATGITWETPDHPKSIAYDNGRNYGEACQSEQYAMLKWKW
jgi:hypothetical protein